MLHYGICSLCVINASYHRAINKNKRSRLGVRIRPAVIVLWAEYGPQALSLTHMLYRVRKGSGPARLGSGWVTTYSIGADFFASSQPNVQDTVLGGTQENMQTDPDRLCLSS